MKIEDVKKHPIEMYSELYFTMVHAIGKEDEDGNKEIFSNDEVAECLELIRNYAKNLKKINKNDTIN